MFIKDGIAYAGDIQPAVKVSGIRPMEGFLLWIRFSTGEAKVFDFKPLLDSPAFAPLRDDAVFRDVYIDYGVAVWMDGDVDISPEYLYNHSIAYEEWSA
ncbi:MAG: DUF2442 domain-containing protein [Candidatus Faecousia sp.]|nr:DUF2442 domain-containing protein [Candidatus Faecousia sp.]